MPQEKIATLVHNEKPAIRNVSSCVSRPAQIEMETKTWTPFAYLSL